MVELLLDAGMDSVADLAFPVGGASLMGGGAPTPYVATFRKICMSK